MKTNTMKRRQFIGQGATLVGAAMLAPGLIQAAAARRTATDQVDLGRTGLKISRLGMGTGSNSGNVQKALGKEEFNKLIRYAYDKGITYFDTAQSYVTYGWIADAIKGLPREKLFLQCKVMGKPQDVLKSIDQNRKTFDTDYVDSLLIHCMVKGQWTDEFKRIMDGFDEAKAKGWIKLKGVSCHSLPALKASVESGWTQVHLVRTNPQAVVIDGNEESWNKSGNDIAPVMTEVKKMHAKGRGVIGMKIIGNGTFTKAEDREKSIRWVMAQPEIHSVVIGFKSKEEIDEAIQRINAALTV